MEKLSEQQVKRKIFSDGVIEVDNPRLSQFLNILEGHRVNDNDTYKRIHKSLCNKIRSEIGITCVIGMALATRNDTGEETVLIFKFPIEATEDNFFDQKVDEETNIPYILV